VYSQYINCRHVVSPLLSLHGRCIKARLHSPKTNPQNAAREVLYLRYLLERLDFAQQKPTPVYEDNSACIEWGNNVIGGRERAKHIDTRKHFAQEVIQNGDMRLIKVPTSA
jgi:hypothetical protein